MYPPPKITAGLLLYTLLSELKYCLFLFITSKSKVFVLPAQSGYDAGQKYVPFTPAYAPLRDTYVANGNTGQLLPQSPSEAVSTITFVLPISPATRLTVNIPASDCTCCRL